MNEKVNQGWGNPSPFSGTSKFHYYAIGGRSLCGKWGRVAGLPQVVDSDDQHSDNCAACKKKIAKYRQKAAKTQPAQETAGGESDA